MTRTIRIAVVAALLASGLAACASKSNRNIAVQNPDEFLVVSRSPLVVPPDYALRPPSPGEPRPQDLNPEAAARAALGGARVLNVAGSEGERLLLTKAHATEADPRIKEVVDDEQGDITHKSKSFADTVMFWRKDQPQAAVAAPQPAAPGANTATPIDATAEATRLAGLTAGQPITIQREPPVAQGNKRFKLPGL